MTDSSEAESFALLCRAAISLRSVFDSPEICTVQTIALLAHYQTFAGKRYTLDAAVSCALHLISVIQNSSLKQWTVMSLAAKLAQSVSDMFNLLAYTKPSINIDWSSQVEPYLRYLRYLG